MDEKQHYIIARIEVDLRTGCWIWKMAKNAYGYGKATYHGKTYKAHRLSHSAFNEPLVDGLYICHHCDTPACVNPDHLFQASHQANMRDMKRKGRR